MTNKLAVLISGGFRDFDVNFPANRKILENCGMPFEIFLHTWRRNPNLVQNPITTIYRSQIQSSPLPLKFKPFLHDEIRDQNILELGIENFEIADFDEQYFVEKFNLNESTENPMYVKQLASCGMWTGVEAVRRMFESRRKSSDVKFTHFVRMRPDFRLRKDLSEQLRCFDIFFGGQLLEVSEGKIGDQFYGGKLDRSSFILDTMGKLLEITSSNEWNSDTPASIAEDVVRKLLYSHREVLNIDFLGPEFGELTRPQTQVDWSNCNLRNLIGIQKHNLKAIRRHAGLLLQG